MATIATVSGDGVISEYTTGQRSSRQLPTTVQLPGTVMVRLAGTGDIQTARSTGHGTHATATTTVKSQDSSGQQGMHGKALWTCQRHGGSQKGNVLRSISRVTAAWCKLKKVVDFCNDRAAAYPALV